MHFAFCLLSQITLAETKPIRIEILRNSGILLDEGWRYHLGDNPDWANPGFDDSHWKAINPTAEINAISQIPANSTGWLRLKFRLSDSLMKEQLALQVRQSISSDIYLNGKFIPLYGLKTSNFGSQSGYDPLGFPVPISFNDSGEQVIAIRFHIPAHIAPFKYWWRIYCMEQMSIIVQKSSEYNPAFRDVVPFRIGIMLVLFVVHLAFFYFEPSQKANLFFSLYAFFAFMANALFHSLMNFINNAELASLLSLPAILCFPFSHLLLVLALYRLFGKQKDVPFAIVLTFVCAGLLSYFFKYEWSRDWNMFWSPLVVGTESVRIAYVASKTDKRGAIIVLAGASIYFIAALILFPPVGIKPSGPWFHLFYTTEALSLLIAMSCYLAFEFAFTNKRLIQTLTDVKQLSEEKETALLQRNAELLSAILEGQTTERKRVAADLHDNLSSTLTAIRWNLLAFNQNKLNDTEKKVYDDLLSMTTSAHDQVRLISHNLLPEQLEKEGLSKALENLIRKVNNSGKIQFSLNVTGFSERLGKKEEFELYSIILELTQNIIKHSGATHASISLRQNLHRIHVIVSDNGIGLQETRQSGIGMENVANRVNSLNGKWKMNSSEGAGVVFEAEFG